MPPRAAPDLSLSTVLQRQTSDLVEDLRQRSDQEPAIKSKLVAEHKAALEGGRTAATYNAWREDVLAQVAVAWVLACVFVRFLEDNELIETPRLSGPVSPVDRRKHAIEAQQRYFEQHPAEGERDFLESVFRDLSVLPGMSALLGQGNANLWRFGPSKEGCEELLKRFRELDEGTEPKLRYDFRDPELSTRFLGDLYQNLSEHARKQYALLQTPDFVEEFILDRTLEPAIQEFGLQGLRMIDPTVGSGHFLLGGFKRLFDRWRAAEPATEPRVLAQRALDSLYGVDLNPFAAEICRFRLLIAALKASGVKRLAQAPAFKINVAIGDSLLHGPRFADIGRAQEMFEREWVIGHTYAHEDVAELRRIFGQRYHVVVGNPPYITVKDKALNALIRDRYGSCKGKYALSVPFLERFVELVLPGEGAHPAGFVGQITANSFMKREFGSKLIEEYLPRWDLTHVIDTSGAYIPGHGTPTVILFLRNRQSVTKDVRAVLGIRGEPTTPDDASRGLVWRAIIDQIDDPDSQSAFISVEDKDRAGFHHHPWSIGGGGAAGLRDALDDAATCCLGDRVASMGFGAIFGTDDVFLLPTLEGWKRHGVDARRLRPAVEGERVRDWSIDHGAVAIYPYNDTGDFVEIPSAGRLMWSYRAVLQSGIYFGRNKAQRGMDWREYGILLRQRLQPPLSITYAEIATHNHFALDRGGKVFNKSAPVIKLPCGATEDDHHALLGLLNSSTACFWLKQVCHCKGSTVDQHGARQTTIPFEDFYAYNSTNLERFPVCAGSVLPYAKALDGAAEELRQIEGVVWQRAPAELAASWAVLLGRVRALLARMISLQEELDWSAYTLYSITEDEQLACISLEAVPELRLGERAFEIALARRVAAGAGEEDWFTRHGSQPIVDLPDHWTAEYRQLVTRRIRRIESDRDVALIESPECKRRWNVQPFEERFLAIVRDRLRGMLETHPVWTSAQLSPISVARLAELVGRNADFVRLAELFTQRSALDLVSVLTDLLDTEHVPYLAALRYKDSGLRKRADWESTWELQREEDRIDALVRLPAGDPKRLSQDEADARKKVAVGEISVPPKYVSADFQQSSYWSNRGKLDVPKERFISYPHGSTDEDPTLLLGWAGWNHAQQAQALGTLYRERKQMGWDAERLRPLLAGLVELVPWLTQWHHDDQSGDLGDFYRGYVESECRELGIQVHELSAWRPPAKQRGRKRKAKDVEPDEAPLLDGAE